MNSSGCLIQSFFLLVIVVDSFLQPHQWRFEAELVRVDRAVSHPRVLLPRRLRVPALPELVELAKQRHQSLLGTETRRSGTDSKLSKLVPAQGSTRSRRGHRPTP